MSPVAAPADRRFRRAHVKPARRRAAGARWLVRWSRVRRRWRSSLVVRRLPRRRRRVAHAHVLADRAHRRARQRSACRRGEVLARARRPARREHALDRPRARGGARLLASPWVRDAALRRVAAGDRRGRRLRAAADRRSAGSTASCIWSTSAASIIDEYGRSTPTSTCRSSTACGGAGGDGGSIDDGARRLAARVIAALQPTAGRRAAAVADRRARRAQRGGDPRAATRRCSARRRPLPARGSSRTWTWRRRCASASPDIDYVDLRFDDRIYVRPVGKAAGRGGAAGAAVASAERLGTDRPEAAWREKNGIWSGSTSAPRR